MKIAILVALALVVATAHAQTYVRPHVNKDGTYVQGHHRTNPNDTKVDNYSSKGNYNPYTGAEGTVDPYKPEPPRQQTCRYTASGRYVCS